MFKIRYKTRKGAVITVLVGADTADEAEQLARKSDPEYLSRVDTVNCAREVWFIKVIPHV